MMAPAHMLSGAVAGGLVGVISQNQDVALLCLILGAVGGLLPDLDHPQSKMGRALPFISYPLNALFGHRGGTHSFLFALLCAFPLFVVDLWLGLAVCFGVLSHLLGDFLTGGVPALYPSKRIYRFKLFNTNSFVEHFIATPILGLILVLILGIL